MNGINLLPWRLEKYRQLLFLFVIKLSLILVLALCLWATISWFQQQQKEALQTQQHHFEQQKTQLTQTLQRVNQLKQTMQHFTELQAIPPKQVEGFLSLLPQLPFQQGELESFGFNAEAIQLKGFCLEQAEFERLHDFLSTHFSSLKLSQFKPEQGRLLFQFELVGIKTDEK
ncbi:PilN domain-containing protein [Rodentibacter myodis]|uniref:Competence protein ComB n=1 Tax=Rodentibacter myodis TaxID=1907939 RepID=A0A1V3JLZ0_9PAST|nr:hypothetical protein [Rodentibacter myodis]OOF57439.1 hypothetical protein BKL49_09050 [Rodentibacter myodis]